MDNETPSTTIPNKQEPRLPSTENMDAGDALQTVAKAGWRVTAFDHTFGTYLLSLTGMDMLFLKPEMAKSSKVIRASALLLSLTSEKC